LDGYLVALSVALVVARFVVFVVELGFVVEFHRISVVVVEFHRIIVVVVEFHKIIVVVVAVEHRIVGFGLVVVEVGIVVVVEVGIVVVVELGIVVVE
jgi:hypothetical protein